MQMWWVTNINMLEYSARLTDDSLDWFEIKRAHLGDADAVVIGAPSDRWSVLGPLLLDRASTCRVCNHGNRCLGA